MSPKSISDKFAHIREGVYMNVNPKSGVAYKIRISRLPDDHPRHPGFLVVEQRKTNQKNWVPVTENRKKAAILAGISAADWLNTGNPNQPPVPHKTADEEIEETWNSIGRADRYRYVALQNMLANMTDTLREMGDIDYTFDSAFEAIQEWRDELEALLNTEALPETKED